jgi:hypothetical protein
VGTIAGTTNRVLVSGATGATSTSFNVTLSTPQDGHTGAVIQYSRLGLGMPPHSSIPLSINDRRILFLAGLGGSVVLVGSTSTGLNYTSLNNNILCIGRFAGGSGFTSNVDNRITVIGGTSATNVGSNNNDLTCILCDGIAGSMQTPEPRNTIVSNAIERNYLQQFNVTCGIETGLQNTGGRSILIGYQCARSFVTSATPMISNVFLGNRAAANIGSSFSSNVYIGNESGLNPTNSNELYISNTSTKSPLFYGNFAAPRLTINGTLTVTTSVVCRNGTVPLAATTGFLYIPTCSGTPVGTPVNQPNTVPLVYDTTNNRLYIYNTLTSTWVSGAF